NTSFSNISVDQKSGRVNFTGGIAPLGSAYFSLEGSETDFSGYSTGTDVFADVLRAGTPGAVLLNANAGFSGAAANNVRLNHIDNEMAMPVVPDQVPTAGPTPGPATAGGILNSYARGTGLELGIGSTLPSPNDPNQIILTALAEQAAPPPTPDGNQPDGSVLKQ